MTTVSFRPRTRLIGLGLGVLASMLVVQGAQVWSNAAFRGIAPICRIETSERVVGLTFDDGPDPRFTPQVLEILTRSDFRATFFVEGEAASHYEDLVAQEVVAGMEIGNHTWSHPRLTTLSLDEAGQEFSRTAALLRSVHVMEARLFRAPYGLIEQDQLELVRGMSLTPVHWSVSLDHYVDGMGLSPRAAADRILRDLRPGDIILAHDARDGGIDRDPAIETLELLSPALLQRGWRVTTVSTLLTEGESVYARPRPWFWQSGFDCPR